jgi:hypothetical protein
MRTLLLISFCFAITAIKAQNQTPVQWKFSSKTLGSDLYELHFTANIDKEWHIYSQSNQGGPGPTQIVYTKQSSVKRKTSIKEEGKLEKRHENLFDADIAGFSNQVDFVQTVQVKKSQPRLIQGYIKYMACNGKICLPPREITFNFTLD